MRSKVHTEVGKSPFVLAAPDHAGWERLVHVPHRGAAHGDGPGSRGQHHSTGHQNDRSQRSVFVSL